MNILIIEDNDVLRENIKTYLELQQMTVDTHSTYAWGSYKILNNSYDCIIMDLGLGSAEGDWLDIIAEVRKEGGSTPIIALTARTSVEQKIEWLKIGADDYMLKPFDYKELVARIEAVVRRDFTNKSKVISIGDLEIHEESMQVFQKWNPVDLSKLEFKLLLFIAQNQWRTLTKELLMEKVWGEVDLFKESRSVDIYIGYLRKKLGADIIQTVRGIGYIMP